MAEKKYNPSSRLKNQLYLDLLNGEYITTLGIPEIRKVMDNIDSYGGYKINKAEAKALVCLLYYTGARPAEILNLTGQDIKKEGTYIYVHLSTLKYGNPRKIAIPLNKPFVNDTWKYCAQVFPTWFLFEKYRGTHRRLRKNKKDEIIEYRELSSKLRYYFRRWFSDIEITPYFLRHNRFSIMSEKGASDEEIRIAKGARSLASVDPYTHLSQKRAKRFTRYL